jgi:predicted MPP superfamily phosphohydrolase
VDLAELARVYERHNVRLLVNETVVHAGVTLTGVDDLAGAPDLRRACAGVAGTPLHLLLAHSPAFRDSVAAHGHPAGVLKPERVAVDGIGMMLSGHTHGGQVALAGWAPLLPPGSGRYARGWFRDGGRAAAVRVARGGDVHAPGAVRRAAGAGRLRVRNGGFTQRHGENGKGG